MPATGKWLRFEDKFCAGIHQLSGPTLKRSYGHMETPELTWEASLRVKQSILETTSSKESWRINSRCYGTGKETPDHFWLCVHVEVEWDLRYRRVSTDVFENQIGSSGDINIAFASMLDKAGFVVDPVILSTRDHGFIRTQVINGKSDQLRCLYRDAQWQAYFLDATEPFIPPNMLPERCLNGQGILILSEWKDFDWLDQSLETMSKSKTVVSRWPYFIGLGWINGQVIFTPWRVWHTKAEKKYAEGQEVYTKELISKVRRSLKAI